MPLADFIAETMGLLMDPPPSGEILVKRVLPLRFAEKNGQHDKIFAGMNQLFA